MFTISIDSIIVTIGHFHLRWYALIVTAAVGLGLWLTVREAGRKGFSREKIADSALWIIVAGLVGARLFHVVDHWPDEFSADPLRILNIWEGGLAIWGGIMGGFTATAILARINYWKFGRLLDAFAPGVVLAQAVGRVACIITGDAIGKPTSGPFGFAYTSPNAVVPKLGVYYTPTPVYEILMNLGIFGLLWLLRKKNFPDGLLTLVYLILYSFLRFFIAFTSAYQEVAFGLNQAQIISILVFFISIPLLAMILTTQRRISLNQ